MDYASAEVCPGRHRRPGARGGQGLAQGVDASMSVSALAASRKSAPSGSPGRPGQRPSPRRHRVRTQPGQQRVQAADGPRGGDTCSSCTGSSPPGSHRAAACRAVPQRVPQHAVDKSAANARAPRYRRRRRNQCSSSPRAAPAAPDRRERECACAACGREGRQPARLQRCQQHQRAGELADVAARALQLQRTPGDGYGAVASSSPKGPC